MCIFLVEKLRNKKKEITFRTRMFLGLSFFFAYITKIMAYIYLLLIFNEVDGSV